MMIIMFVMQCCCLAGGEAAADVFVQTGMATYYGDEFHGRKTASGETYNKWELTCAHKKLPFGTKLKVTNLKNKKSVVVRVNDRGPWVKNRIIDLSFAAAREIDMIADGVVKVKIVAIK
jgi:rare lipoprotein A